MNTQNQPNKALAKKASAQTNKKKEGTLVETQSQHPLGFSIPSKDWYTGYVSREIAGVADLDIFASAHRLGHNVLLAGPTGSAIEPPFRSLVVP